MRLTFLIFLLSILVITLSAWIVRRIFRSPLTHRSASFSTWGAGVIFLLIRLFYSSENSPDEEGYRTAEMVFATVYLSLLVFFQTALAFILALVAIQGKHLLAKMQFNRK